MLIAYLGTKDWHPWGRRTGICLGTIALAHDSSLKEKAEGEQGIYAMALWPVMTQA